MNNISKLLKMTLTLYYLMNSN